MSYKINKKAYADMYGPTVGDKIRLADTNLIIEIEKDYANSKWGKNLYNNLFRWL